MNDCWNSWINSENSLINFQTNLWRHFRDIYSWMLREFLEESLGGLWKKFLTKFPDVFRWEFLERILGKILKELMKEFRKPLLMNNWGNCWRNIWGFFREIPSKLSEQISGKKCLRDSKVNSWRGLRENIWDTTGEFLKQFLKKCLYTLLKKNPEGIYG